MLRRAALESAERRGVPCPKGKKPGHGASNTVRHVDTWHPVHAWSTEDVWSAVNRSGLRPHSAYAAGMPRLSCSFRVLASRPALIRAAQLRPALAAEYAAIEAKTGHRFQSDVSMAEIIAEAERAKIAAIPCWEG
ncbi:hypothetical protein AB0L33_33660 [Streptomyces sp. NPDC052299]|uniref:hypothetical protein n=1 Tax=Streptomyces sp. NPDC052299 TaxID=3155054 RepID=UPI003425959E